MAVVAGANTFRILGPVQVLAAGRPVQFPRRQQRDLLAFLLLHLERTVSVEQIIDAMWAEAVPDTARRQIGNMLSAVRQALALGGRPLATIDRRSSGYRLSIVDGTLDLAAFTGHLRRAEAAPTPWAAVGRLRDAVSMWDGDLALADVRAAYAPTARIHLREQRDAAYERLFDAELECGNHVGIAEELAALVEADPARERFAAQLMTVLYRQGRPRDALDVYRRTRRVLVEEYGLEPGRALQDLQRLILLRDPVPTRPAATASGRGPPTTATAPVPAQLPADVHALAGRRTDVMRLDALLCRPPHSTDVGLAVVTGMAGVGKSALAVHWAHHAASGFPDGQLYLDLYGHAAEAPIDPYRALLVLLDGLGAPANRVPGEPVAAGGLYRSLLASRRVLVILDDARDAEQVRPLIPGRGRSRLLVTSRDQLTGLAVTHDARSVDLGPLSRAGASAVLDGILGPPSSTEIAAARAALAEECGWLPLALRIAAAMLNIDPIRPAADLVTALSTAGGLARLSVAGDPRADLQTAFEHSYRHLDPELRTVFRRIGLAPTPEVDAASAAALAGIPTAAAEPALVRLATVHLLQRTGSGRYGCHRLLWRYARNRVQAEDSATERTDAVARLRAMTDAPGDSV